MNTVIGRLLAERLVARALVLAAAVTACYSPADYDTRPTGVALSFSADTAFADGASLVVIMISAPPHAQSGLTATLAVSAGTLIGASSASLSLPLASEDTVRAYWRAPQTLGTGVLTVTVGTWLALQDSVRFVTAYPETVEVEPDSPAVAATADAMLTFKVYLRRPVGAPTLGTRVTLDARDRDSLSVGRFLSSTPSDATGLVTARFAPGTTTSPGRVTIWATVGAGPAARTGQTYIEVTN
jgi:hypothetical protein